MTDGVLIGLAGEASAVPRTATRSSRHRAGASAPPWPARNTCPEAPAL